MSELLSYAELGVRHILDPGAIDHLLFLLVLAAAYRPGAWGKAVRVVTAFTVGHSVTLVLAATNALVLPAPAIEFLIPLTIVATGIENLAVSARPSAAPRASVYRPILAAVFGLVHGAGFANYLRELFLESITVPLLGFNFGIEAGQLVVLAVSGAALLLLDRLTSPRVRVAVSVAVLLVATRMAMDRSPWQP